MLQLVFASCATKTVDGKNEIAFGLGDGLPWGHIKQDMKNFKARTSGTHLIMGAKTFMSFESPLPGREHIVVASPGRAEPTTKNGTKASGYISPEQFREFLAGRAIIMNELNHGETVELQRDYEDFSIIGGKALIEQSYESVDKIIHTSIMKKHRVNSDVQLEPDFLMKAFWNKPATETHWYLCDELTSLTETVYQNV